MIPEKTCFLSDSSEKPPVNTAVKNSEGGIIIIIIIIIIIKHLALENLDVAKKRKPSKRNGIPPNSSTRQRHKNQSYQSENR